MKSATTMHAGLGLVFLHYLKYQVDENSEMAKQVKKTLKANQFKKKKKSDVLNLSLSQPTLCL